MPDDLTGRRLTIAHLGRARSAPPPDFEPPPMSPPPQAPLRQPKAKERPAGPPRKPPQAAQAADPLIGTAEVPEPPSALPEAATAGSLGAPDPKPGKVKKPKPPKGPARLPKTVTPAERLARRLARDGLTTADVNAVKQRLIDSFPVFDPAVRRPLAIGIREAILEALPDLHPLAVSTALRHWCTDWRYLRRMAQESSHRHHLDGSRAAELTAEEKAHAQAGFDTARQRWKARQAGKR